MTNLVALRAANANRWAGAKLTRSSEFNPVARRLLAAKARYQAVAKQTGVPWFFIAVVHQRESSQNWNGSLAQGDPWNEVSKHVPAGRGPFNSWEEAAVDALVSCPPYAARNTDWSPGGLLTMLEEYNGLGYANKGIPSPYLWSGTDQYERGKYVADGKFSATAVDKQLGCAGLLLVMKALDPTITFGASSMPIATTPTTAPVTPTDHAKVGGAVVVATGTAGAAAAANAGVSALQIIAWIGGLSAVAIAAFIIGFRITKGHWPWTSISTGNQSPELSHPSLQSSVPSSERVSAALSAVSSAALLEMPSPVSSASKQLPKPWAKRSRKTPTPRAKSNKSKPSAAKKSAPKRKSISKR